MDKNGSNQSNRQLRRAAFVNGVQALLNSGIGIYRLVTVTKMLDVDGMDPQKALSEPTFLEAVATVKTEFHNPEFGEKEKKENAGYFVTISFAGKTIAIVIMQKLVTNSQLTEIGEGLSLLTKNITDKVEQKIGIAADEEVAA